MINQIKAQSLRLWKRKGNLLVALLLFAINFMFVCEKWPMINDANEILEKVIGDASFIIIISLCVAWFVGSEFSERTIQNEMKLGYSRGSVMFVRFLYSGILAIILHISYILGVYAGVIYKFGLPVIGLNADSIIWLLVVLFQIVVLQSFTIFIVFILKKPLPSMVVSTLLSFIGCNVIRNFTESKIYTWSCFSLAQNNEHLTLYASTLYALGTLVVVMLITYLLFRKADME